MSLVLLKDIEALEDELKKLPQLANNVRHFTDVKGIYMRELSIPAHAVLTGKVHVTESYSIVTKGKIAVVCNDGSEKVLQSGDIYYSPPGSKKAGYAFEDTLFVTVHRCDLKDITEIESFLAVDSMKDYQNRLELLDKVGV